MLFSMPDGVEVYFSKSRVTQSMKRPLLQVDQAVLEGLELVLTFDEAEDYG